VRVLLSAFVYSFNLGLNFSGKTYKRLFTKRGELKWYIRWARVEEIPLELERGPMLEAEKTEEIYLQENRK